VTDIQSKVCELLLVEFDRQLGTHTDKGQHRCITLTLYFLTIFAIYMNFNKFWYFRHVQKLMSVFCSSPFYNSVLVT